MATESVEAIVAEMRKAAPRVWALRGLDIDDWARRLQSAHDAELGALREAVMFQEGARSNAEVALAVAESRLREAERDARRWQIFRQRFDSPEQRAWLARGVGVEDGHLEPSLDAAIDRAMEGEDG